ncbi:MAG: hypothetical protein K9K67_03080 [Bacteriovoracaceae bacterium]|nr:hypothetical protein [Bacteriovoracaceae bacterium]
MKMLIVTTLLILTVSSSFAAEGEREPTCAEMVQVNRNEAGEVIRDDSEVREESTATTVRERG